jgi:hypothetical protein
MKTFLTVLLLMSSAFAQQISQNPGAPDFLQGGGLAPAIGSAGSTNPCQVVPYEAWYAPLPSSLMLLMKMGPCQWNIDQFGIYVLQAPIHIQSVHCWIGTSANARFETVSNAQIWIKDSANSWHMMFDELCEFDKHQDITGNTDKMWTYPLGIDIPAGAVVTVYRYPGGLIFCGQNDWQIEPTSPQGSTRSQPSNGIDPTASWDKCATEIHWRFYGTGK